MSPKMKLAVPMALCLASQAFAESPKEVPFSEACPDIRACVDSVSNLTGQKYIFENTEIKGVVPATRNVILTRENAELLLTNALSLAGFSRVPVGEADTYEIVRTRDARDAAITIVAADRNNAPSLPKTWDLMTMKYKASHPESIEAIARTIRSFMPANSRIIPAEGSGMLFVTDTAPNLKKVYELIRDNDEKMPEWVKKKNAEREKNRRFEHPSQAPIHADSEKSTAHDKAQ